MFGNATTPFKSLSLKKKKKRVKIQLKTSNKKKMQIQREKERPKEFQYSKKYNADTERDGESSLARLRAPLQAERKIYGHHRINTIRLYICHYQIVEIGYEILLFRFGYEILLFIEFFRCIGLDLILVLIPFCFGLLGSP